MQRRSTYPVGGNVIAFPSTFAGHDRVFTQKNAGPVLSAVFILIAVLLMSGSGPAASTGTTSDSAPWLEAP